MHHLNKLISKDLVIGLPKLKFKKDHLCEACQKGKQIKHSFKLKNIVSTSNPLELLHMDLFGPLRTMSLGGNYYALVAVDDFSRYTWTLFWTGFSVVLIMQKTSVCVCVCVCLGNLLLYMLYVCIVSVLQVLVHIQTNQHKQPGICLHQIGGDCWSRMILKLWCLQIHGAWWKVGVAAFVGGFWVEWCVIHSLFESKTVWNQNLFLKRMFYKEVEKQPVVLSF